ncbi:hypothetical protein, partial [Rhizobium laguerreae]|uniref:hypothetical protein n=1 Tax=Rhizobium laguerreae TaxID=1076926 RepID=UPI00197DB99E
QSLIRKPYLEVAHFSVEKPAQFRVETNNPPTEPPSGAVFSVSRIYFASHFVDIVRVSVRYHSRFLST